MKVFKNRYQAEKERKNNPYCRSTDKIVKVCGGYVIMDQNFYCTWKKQK